MIEPLEEQAAPTLRLTPPLVVARNSFLNLCAEIWTFLIVFATMPTLIRSLGKDGFGLFSLAWVILGYMAILDLGVSRAATKFISEHLSREQSASVKRVCRAALTSNFVLGIVGGLMLWVLAPWFTEHLFKVPPSLRPRAHTVFSALAFSIPFLLVQAEIRAVLSSYQKFGWINILNSAAVTFQWGGAFVLAILGFPVQDIVIVCVSVRALFTVGFALALAQIDPQFLKLGISDLGVLWRLLRFGGWVSLSQLMTPILLYLDRILIASLGSLSAMTLYVIPSEIIARLRVIPSSLVSSLFPSLSEHSTAAVHTARLRLYGESLKYILLILFPCFLMLALFGSDIISIWVGPEYADAGGSVLRILSLGGLLNALGFVPYAALVALGRPDLPAKFHLLELPLYVGLSFLLIPKWGITGAAIAVAFRLAIDSVALFWAANKFVQCSIGFQRIQRVLVLNFFLACFLVLVRMWSAPAAARLACGAICVLAYFFASWFLVLGNHERPLFLRILQFGGRVA